MPAAGEFRVDLEAVMCAAAHVSGQGEDLAIAQLSSDNRIEAARAGWVGASGAALDIRMAAWLARSRMLLTRIGEHAARLNDVAIGFAAMEHDNAQALRAVGKAAGGL